MVKLTVATRKSPMALAQTKLVCHKLQVCFPELKLTLLPLVSKGDKLLSTSLSKIGGKGLFVKELEQALFEGKADFAVHSAKDLPYFEPAGLTLAAFVKRDNPFDALVSNHYQSFKDLPSGAVIGTSSLRRQALIKHLRPDLQVEFLRGNVNTRLRYLDEGKFDAIILAVAGLERLGFNNRVAEVLALPDFVPAIGQGALAIQCRANDDTVLSYLSRLNDAETAHALIAERAVSRKLEADCHSPLAAFAYQENSQLMLQAMCAHPDGQPMIRLTKQQPLSHDASILGAQMAEALLAKGAGKLLQSTDEL